MHKRREGFTLIELLIVIVIIGILAAIALPKFGATREKAYVKAMESDLRNLAAQQEIYYSDSDSAYEYFNGTLAWDANQENDLGLTISTGVTLVITFVPADMTATPAVQPSWNAVATHEASSQTCAIFTGGDPVDPAENPGVIKCKVL
jgi:prepilin-type N-terminal cleavage/methylation domain-containing protein